MNVEVKKVGGIWHGTIEGYPDVDVRGLTEDVARRKIESIAEQLRTTQRTPFTPPSERKE